MTPEYKDPILEEIREIREKMAADANYDVDAIYQRRIERWGTAELPKSGPAKAVAE